jgi:hypothetical protein
LTSDAKPVFIDAIRTIGFVAQPALYTLYAVAVILSAASAMINMF